MHLQEQLLQEGDAASVLERIRVDWHGALCGYERLQHFQKLWEVFRGDLHKGPGGCLWSGAAQTVRGHDWLQVHKCSRALTRLPYVFVNSCCPLERRVMEYYGCALASRENVHLHDLA